MEGVRINFVRAMSKGARIMPASPAAETDTNREAKGDGEDSISRPPAGGTLAVVGDDVKERPGSGRARKAEKTERMKDEIVERSSEWT